MNAARALQAAVFEHLKANSAVAAIVGARVYDHPPASAAWKKPYLAFGTGYSVDADADCIDAREHTLQIDCWSRDQGRLGPCRDLADAVHRALHRAELVADPPFAISAMRVVLNRVFADPDGKTAHGVVQVRALVQEN